MRCFGLLKQAKSYSLTGRTFVYGLNYIRPVAVPDGNDMFAEFDFRFTEGGNVSPVDHE